MGETPGMLQYSTQSENSCTVPLPTLPEIYGSQPSWRQTSRNSCVPKALFSVTPPQLVLTMVLRCALGPTPSRQW